MSRAVACGLALAAAAGLAGCESTQDKARRRQAESARALQGREGLKITAVNRDVAVLGKTILSDKNGTAVVVELENRGRDQADVPIAIRLADAKGKKVFANDAPGLEPALVSIPLLQRGKDAYWVHNQVLPAGTPEKLDVRVGRARPAAVPAEPPHITLSEITLDRDQDGAFVTGVVHNRSTVIQKRLTIFAVAKKGDRVVAAGRAVVDKLPAGPQDPKKPTRFTVYFIGNPAGATLDFTVPPVELR